MLFNHGTYRRKLHMEDDLRDLKNTPDICFVSLRALVDACYTIEIVDQFSTGIETAENT